MPTVLNPYIMLRGNARDAVHFYASVFGGQPEILTYAAGGMPPDAGDPDQVMHAYLGAPNGMALMCSDVPPSMDLQLGGNISVSLSGDDEPELRGYWDKLIEGGAATMPLAAAPWGDTFGSLKDRFGVNWLVNITGTGR